MLRSAAGNATATVALVSMALTAEGAAAPAVGGSTGLCQGRESCTSAWPAVAPGRVRAGSCRAGGRCGVGGGAADCARQGTPSGPPPSSARRSSAAQLCTVYGNSSAAAGRLSSAGPAGRGPDAAAGRAGEWRTMARCQTQTPRTCQDSGQVRTTSSSGGGSMGSHAGAAAMAAGLGGLACSPAKPVPGGVLVQLDGPAWDAAEWAADTASWCLSSRSSRQRASPSSGCECAPGLNPKQLQNMRDAQVAAPPTALSSTGNAAALVAAAEQLLSKPLPPGSLGSGCRPVSLPGLSEDGGAGAHVDQAVSASE